MTNATHEMLRASGFTETQAQRYLELEQQGSVEACMRMLRCRRCELLDALHEAQRPIDVIDWALYELQRKHG